MICPLKLRKASLLNIMQQCGPFKQVLIFWGQIILINWIVYLLIYHIYSMHLDFACFKLLKMLPIWANHRMRPQLLINQWQQLLLLKLHKCINITFKRPPLRLPLKPLQIKQLIIPPHSRHYLRKHTIKARQHDSSNYFLQN